VGVSVSDTETLREVSENLRDVESCNYFVNDIEGRFP
jgi:hypothetical protein